jgi:UbiD family decarboxylase
MDSFKSLRDFLEVLEGHDQLVRVKEEVDKDKGEISAIARTVCFKYRLDQRPALLFEKVRGYGIPVAMGTYSSPKRVAMALGIFEEDPKRRWQATLQKFIDAYNYKTEPKLIGKNYAPCKENIVIGDDVDVTMFPVPIWTPGKDAGPYITSGGLVTRDPETGEQNIGNYRIQVKGRNKLGLYAGDGQDAFNHWKKAFALNRALPVAIVIGVPGTVLFPQIYRVPYDELWMAGGFDRKPLEVVRCETSDLVVPAQAEIVIEGEIPPNYYEVEGPFGEAFGVISPPKERPVIIVKAITYRNEPIYHCLMSSYVPGTASATRTSVKPFFVYNTLRLAGVPEVKDIYLPEAATGTQILIVSIKKMWNFHPRHVMYAIWGSKAVHDCKFIIVTDEDVNIRDPFEVARAFYMRVDPGRDVVITTGGSWTIDPTLGSKTEERSTTAAKMGIDATMPYNYDISLPNKELFDKIEQEWDKYQIMPLDDPVYNIF